MLLLAVFQTNTFGGLLNATVILNCSTLPHNASTRGARHDLHLCQPPIKTHSSPTRPWLLESPLIIYFSQQEAPLLQSNRFYTSLGKYDIFLTSKPISALLCLLLCTLNDQGGTFVSYSRAWNKLQRGWEVSQCFLFSQFICSLSSRTHFFPLLPHDWSNGY